MTGRAYPVAYPQLRFPEKIVFALGGEKGA